MGATVRPESAEARLALFERALAAVWARAQRTLGEVTLGAIAERVLHTVSKRYLVLSALDADASGFRFDRLRGQEELIDLDEAIELMLVQLLTVIGNLTADILTPGLHAALSGVARDETAKNPASGSPPARDASRSGGAASERAPSEIDAGRGTKT